MGGAGLANDPSRLCDLLDYFREEAGYGISAHEYAIAQELILALIARGEDLSDEAISRCLAPVLCATPREQADYPEHFRRWSTREHRPHTPPPDSIERDLKRAERDWKRWRWVLLVVAIAIAIFVGVLALRLQPQTPGPVEASTPGGLHLPIDRDRLTILSLTIGAGFLFVLAAWSVWWYRRADLLLRRRTTDWEPQLVSISFSSGLDRVIDYALLKRAARELRRRFPVPSQDLAIPETIRATLHNHAQFTPVFRSRLVAPEYVILIDRASFQDHNAFFLDQIFNSIEADQVRMQRFYFDRDPRTLYPQHKGETPLLLKDLACNFGESRVLVFADADGFFNPVTNELDSWTEPLWRWSKLAFFLAKPPQSWSYPEKRLAQQAPVFPATLESIIAFAQWANGARSRPTDASEIGGPFPVELSDHPSRWLERDVPDPELVSDVLGSVKRFLGAEAYLWLCACAVYPELQFNLTNSLGANLSDAEGHALITAERLSALFRLPWFKAGYMPDWLRLYLVTDLPPDQLTRIRELLSGLWLSAASGSQNAINLEIALRTRKALSEVAKRAFRKLARRSPKESVLHDHVFASVMLGRSFERLAVRVPGRLRSILRYRQASAAAKVSPVRRTLARTVSAALVILPLSYLFGRLFGVTSEILPDVVFVAEGVFIVSSLLLGLIWLHRRLLWMGLLCISAWPVGVVLYVLLAALQGFSPDIDNTRSLVAYQLLWLAIGACANLDFPWSVSARPSPRRKTVKALFWTSFVLTAIGMVLPFGTTLLALEVTFITPFEAMAGLRMKSRSIVAHSLFPLPALLFSLPSLVLVPLLLLSWVLLIPYVGASIWFWLRIRKAPYARDTSPAPLWQEIRVARWQA
jgi:hypothetical protein